MDEQVAVSGTPGRPQGASTSSAPGVGSELNQPTVNPTAADKASTSAARNRRVRPTWSLYVLFFVVAGVVGGTISWGFLSDSLAALGIPDPGVVTTAGLPFLRAAGWMIAALSVGGFLASTFLISPRTVDGVNDLRRAMLNV